MNWQDARPSPDNERKKKRRHWAMGACAPSIRDVNSGQRRCALTNGDYACRGCNGNVLGITDRRTSPAQSRTRSMGYDERDRLTSVGYAASDSSSFRWMPFGKDASVGGFLVIRVSRQVREWCGKWRAS